VLHTYSTAGAILAALNIVMNNTGRRGDRMSSRLADEVGD
jgi:hypothetical protein